jgi:hypothetical protein
VGERKRDKGRREGTNLVVDAAVLTAGVVRGAGAGGDTRGVRSTSRLARLLDRLARLVDSLVLLVLRSADVVLRRLLSLTTSTADALTLALQGGAAESAQRGREKRRKAPCRFHTCVWRERCEWTGCRRRTRKSARRRRSVR